MKSTLPTISPCSHMTPLFYTADAFCRSQDPADFTISLSYPPAVLTASYLGQHSFSNFFSPPAHSYTLPSVSSSLSLFTENYFSFPWQQMDKHPTYPSATFGSTSSLTAPWDRVQGRWVLLMTYLHVTPPLNYVLIPLKTVIPLPAFFF